MPANRLNLQNRLKAYYNNSGPHEDGTTNQELPDCIPIRHICKGFGFHPENNRLSLLPPAEVYLNAEQKVCSADLLFFDLETTGLGSGPNTYAFLAGFGRLLNGKLMLDQFLLNSPAYEREFLQKIKGFFPEQGSTAPVIVSFNGKSYDVPFIKRRMIQNNMETHNISNHIDLYPILRKIFPQKPARLKEAEHKILSYQRRDDLPGSMAPQAYFEFLRFKETEKINGVLYHNELDILSLSALTVKLDEAIRTSLTGKISWAPALYRLEGSREWQKEQLLKTSRDARAEQQLAIVFKKEKKMRLAVIFFIRSAQKGRHPALVEAVKILIRIKKYALARILSDYGLLNYDYRTQEKMWKQRERLEKISSVPASAQRAGSDHSPPG